jgi:succinate dehydrogenase hydrophobic anchor subunit
MRNPLFLLLWGLAISALGLWHIVTWVQNPDVDKEVFKLAVGIFCVFVGIIVVVLNRRLSGKRKDN